MNARFKYVILISTILLISQQLNASFTLESLLITAYIQDDGGVYVTEEYNIHISGNESIRSYSEGVNLLKRNDIQAWRDKLNIPFTYHLGGQPATITDFTITPEPVVILSQHVEDVYVTITLAYTIDPPQDSSGLFTITTPAPRILRFTINKDGFMFEKTSSGGIILPQNTELTFVFPEGMTITRLNPIPKEFSGKLPPFIGVNTISWKRTPVLSGFTLEFEKELSLEEEIIQFVDELQRSIASLFSGQNLLPSLIIITALTVAVVYLHRIRRKGEQKRK